MRSCGKKHRFTHGLAGLPIVVAWLCWRTFAPAIAAQEPRSPAMAVSQSASLSGAEYLLRHADAQSHDDPIRTVEVASSPIRMPHRAPTEAEVWGAFEAGFKLPQKSRSPVKRQIESVKYGLDVTTFAIDHFVGRIKQDADFSFHNGHPHRATDDQMIPTRNRPHAQLDMDVWRSKPYIGVKVIIPFGN